MSIFLFAQKRIVDNCELNDDSANVLPIIIYISENTIVTNLSEIKNSMIVFEEKVKIAPLLYSHRIKNLKTASKNIFILKNISLVKIENKHKQKVLLECQIKKRSNESFVIYNICKNSLCVFSSNKEFNSRYFFVFNHSDDSKQIDKTDHSLGNKLSLFAYHTFTNYILSRPPPVY